MIEPNVTITPAAAQFIRRMVRFSQHPAGGLRLHVTPGGCSGYSSEFTVESAPRTGDSVLAVGEVKLFLPAESRLVLDGVIMDFAESPTQSGLTFTHPHATTCGCSSAGEAAAPAQASVSVASIRRLATPAGH
jgi:iron-sulfur cluster assembly accessory protein